MSTPILEPNATVTVGDLVVVPQDGEVTLDETTTYATADYTIPLLDVAVMESIDPRDDVRTTITLESRVFDLGIRERTVDHETKTIRITAASDEAMLAEYARLTDDTAPVALASSLRAVVNYVLGVVIPGKALEASPGTDAAVTETDALTWRAGVTAWEFLLALTSAASVRLFCDELRRWRLVPTSYMVPGSVAALASTSKSGTDTISRDGDAWVTGVVVVYEWTDSAGAHRKVDSAGLPGKVDVIRLTTAYPGPGAAQARLNRLRGQGRTQAATTFANYGETPGMEARIKLPGAYDQYGRVQRVVFPLLDGYVELGTRELTEVPPTAYMFGDVKVAFEDVPMDMTYEAFDWEAI